MNRFIGWITDRVIIELARRQTEQSQQMMAFNAAMSQCTHGTIGMMTTDGPLISRDGGQNWYPLD